MIASGANMISHNERATGHCIIFYSKRLCWLCCDCVEITCLAPSKHDILSQCSFNAHPPSSYTDISVSVTVRHLVETLVKRVNRLRCCISNLVSTYFVCWDGSTSVSILIHFLASVFDAGKKVNQN